MAVTMVLVGSQLAAELRTHSQLMPVFPITSRSPMALHKHDKPCRGFILLPSSSASLFSQTSALPAVTTQPREAPRFPCSPYHLPFPTHRCSCRTQPQSRPRKQQIHSKKGRKKESYLQRSFSLSTSLPQ